MSRRCAPYEALQRKKVTLVLLRSSCPTLFEEVCRGRGQKGQEEGVLPSSRQSVEVGRFFLLRPSWPSRNSARALIRCEKSTPCRAWTLLLSHPSSPIPIRAPIASNHVAGSVALRRCSLRHGSDTEHPLRCIVLGRPVGHPHRSKRLLRRPVGKSHALRASQMGRQCFNHVGAGAEQNRRVSDVSLAFPASAENEAPQSSISSQLPSRSCPSTAIMRYRWHQPSFPQRVRRSTA